MWKKKIQNKPLIIEDVKDWNQDKFEYRLRRDDYHLHVQCTHCGADLYIEPGSYEDERFRRVYEDQSDGMNDIYIFRCPTCDYETPIKAQNMEVFELKE